jgi:hypothetical protein
MRSNTVIFGKWPMHLHSTQTVRWPIIIGRWQSEFIVRWTIYHCKSWKWCIGKGVPWLCVLSEGIGLDFMATYSPWANQEHSLQLSSSDTCFQYSADTNAETHIRVPPHRFAWFWYTQKIYKLTLVGSLGRLTFSGIVQMSTHHTERNVPDRFIRFH